MTIVTIEKSPTWVDMITSLEVGQEINAPYEKMRYLTSLISGQLRYKHPNMAFETRKSKALVKGKDVAVICIKRTI